VVFPAVTAFYAAVLALIYCALSSWVIAGRFTHGILHGTGENADMLLRMRTHANFIEYVPLIVILLGLYEAAGGSAARVRIMLIVLVVARLMHPVGMVAPANSLQQYAFRATSVIATLALMAMAAVLLLGRV
jgi:hypothetical protein